MVKKKTEKEIKDQMAKIQKRYHHDIKYIDERFVEDVVADYQKTKNEDILLKIIGNYQIFANTWAYDFAPFCDNDLESGEAMFKEVIWRCAKSFNIEKTKKEKGRAFNAYLISGLCNRLKNDRSANRSQKHAPRCICPICGDRVVQVEAKHLTHVIDLDRYRRTYQRYPLVSTDGFVTSPLTGEPIDKITDAHLNYVNKSYTVEDFKRDYSQILPKFPITCPATFMSLRSISAKYPSLIQTGYTEKKFIEEHPDFAGIITCPFSGRKVLEVTQEHLDKVLGQRANTPRIGWTLFNRKFQNATLKARPVKVFNPYTKKMVKEITPEMLAAAGTTIMDHLSAFQTIQLDTVYPDKVTCPFTGRSTRRIKRSDIEALDRTPIEFSMACCKYPLKKWQVKCAICDKWVDNIWSHLENVKHTYASPMSMEDFEKSYGIGATKVTVSTNSFFENDSGDSVHVGDMLIKTLKSIDPLELEDSLLRASLDDLDTKIAHAMRNFQTIDDICDVVSEKHTIRLRGPFQTGGSREVRELIRERTDCEDFDFSEPPRIGDRKVEVLIPGKETIKDRLRRLVQLSDLEVVEQDLTV